MTTTLNQVRVSRAGRLLAAHDRCWTRIRSAGFPTRKSLEDFNFDSQLALNRDMLAAHFGTGATLAYSRNLFAQPIPGMNTPR